MIYFHSWIYTLTTFTLNKEKLLTTPTIPPTASNSLLSPQTIIGHLHRHHTSTSWYSFLLMYQNVMVAHKALQKKYRHPPYNMVMKHKDRRIWGVDTALKNNYFAEQLLMAITLHGLSSLCTYIVLLVQKLSWVESFTIFVNFELIRESLWRWKFSLGWFAKVYLCKFLYELKNSLNEAKKSSVGNTLEKMINLAIHKSK